MSESHSHTADSKEIFKKVWMPFIILLVVTVIEFVIALGINMPHNIKAFLYIGLTIIKAGYIVGYFMHLKFERLALMYAILVPILFIIALIFALMFEASTIPGAH